MLHDRYEFKLMVHHYQVIIQPNSLMDYSGKFDKMCNCGSWRIRPFELISTRAV
jgi:hypothetical protein